MNKWFVAALLVTTLVFSTILFKDDPDSWLMLDGWIDIGLIAFLILVSLPRNPFRKKD